MQILQGVHPDIYVHPYISLIHDGHSHDGDDGDGDDDDGDDDDGDDDDGDNVDGDDDDLCQSLLFPL